MVLVYSSEDDSTEPLHRAHGVGATINMVVHYTAYACLTPIHGEYSILAKSPFRYIPTAVRVRKVTTPASTPTLLTRCFLLRWFSMQRMETVWRVPFTLSCVPLVHVCMMLSGTCFLWLGPGTFPRLCFSLLRLKCLVVWLGQRLRVTLLHVSPFFHPLLDLVHVRALMLHRA